MNRFQINGILRQQKRQISLKQNKPVKKDRDIDLAQQILILHHLDALEPILNKLSIQERQGELLSVLLKGDFRNAKKVLLNLRNKDTKRFLSDIKNKLSQIAEIKDTDLINLKNYKFLSQFFKGLGMKDKEDEMERIKDKLLQLEETKKNGRKS